MNTIDDLPDQQPAHNPSRAPKSEEHQKGAHQDEGQQKNEQGDTDAIDMGANMRPNTLKAFVGQQDIRKNLHVFIQAARSRKKPLDHILLHGPPGLGKTTLAQIAAQEMRAPIRISSGPVIMRSGDLAAILTSLESQSVLFVDEIHRLPKPVEETLYAAMEDQRLDIIIGEGPGARTVRLELPQFTLIGATTRAGLLSTPLHDRFGIVLQLNYYSEEELIHILTQQSILLGVGINNAGALAIASRARGTPRVAGRLLRRITDFAEVENHKIITQELVEHALSVMGIDHDGLTVLDQQYLYWLGHHYGGGPVGVSTLSSALNAARETLETVVEPYLIRLGLMMRTARGRVLSPAGMQRLQSINTQTFAKSPAAQAHQSLPLISDSQS